MVEGDLSHLAAATSMCLSTGYLTHDLQSHPVPIVPFRGLWFPAFLAALVLGLIRCAGGPVRNEKRAFVVWDYWLGHEQTGCSPLHLDALSATLLLASVDSTDIQK
jgi:hypothetical protein